MDFNLANALSVVKVAIKETADKSSLRVLQSYTEKISCKSGCSACCNRQIYLTVAEALVIQDHLEKTGQWEQIELRANSVAKIALNTPPISWFKMNIMCQCWTQLQDCAAHTMLGQVRVQRIS